MLCVLNGLSLQFVFTHSNGFETLVHGHSNRSHSADWQGERLNESCDLLLAYQ